MKKIIQFIACLLAPLTIGGISGYFTASNIADWYKFINKPSFNPPNYLFGPVWTFLYILMGISLYIILQKVSKPDKTKAIACFVIQLSLNFLWSFVFFYFHQIGLAFIEIILLWISILTMILVFRKTSTLAAYLNIPYLLWVSFASILNFSIYILN